jgi:hypothetical protein
MYAVITKVPENEIPVVVNTNNSDYADYLLCGYEVIYEGHKRECLDIQANLLEEYKID